MRQMGRFPPPPGLHLSTIPSSACPVPMHQDPGSEDGRSWGTRSGSTSALIPNDAPLGIAGSKVPHAPSTSHEPSAGAFLLQLVRGKGVGLESSGHGSSQEQHPTTEMGAALLRQLRGEGGGGISSKTRSAQVQGSRAADEGAERGKTLLMHLFNPGLGSTVDTDNGPHAATRTAAINHTSKIKSVEACAGDYNATGSASVEGAPTGSSPDPCPARASKGAGKAQTRSKIRANAAAARAGVERDSQKRCLASGSTRQQCAIAAAWVDDWNVRRSKGKKGALWSDGTEAPPTTATNV